LGSEKRENRIPTPEVNMAATHLDFGFWSTSVGAAIESADHKHKNNPLHLSSIGFRTRYNNLRLLGRNREFQAPMSARDEIKLLAV
jgi:hypothetical protein